MSPYDDDEYDIDARTRGSAPADPPVGSTAQIANGLSAHTPGPWTVAHFPNSRQSRVVAQGGVEFLETANPGISTDTWNANLCLIAAAPDLLAALKMAEAYASLNTADPRPPTQEQLATWRAAIAKAEGAR